MKVSVIFRGLLHFVENSVGDEKVKVCAVLPQAPGHSSSISAFLDTRFLLDSKPFSGPIQIANKRVALRFTKLPEAPAQVGPGFEDGVMKQRTIGAVPLEALLGLFNSDRSTSIVSSTPSSNIVRSQVLLGEGAFSVLASSVPPRLDLPGELTGLSPRQITMSEKVRMDVDNLKKAEIVVYPLSSSTVPEAIYVIDPLLGDQGLIELKHLCTPSGAIEIQDKDFRFHYLMLRTLPGGKAIDSMPVPSMARFSGASESIEFEKMFFDKLDFQARGCNCAGARGLSRKIDLEDFMQ